VKIKNDNSLSTIGKKQTYFIKPSNILKLQKIKKETHKGYSEIINELIESAWNSKQVEKKESEA
jgi:hypothetical protein